MRFGARPCTLLLLIATTIAVGACGGADDTRVLGAASLKEVLPTIPTDEAITFSFAGSDTLAQQIREGAPADAFLAASPTHPQALADEDRCTAPVPFATNTLSLIVPADDAAVTQIGDLRRDPPRRLALGDAGVPIGAYTRDALTALGADDILTRNAVSLEPDASGIVAKVALGSADAGIAYTTDAMIAGGDVIAIPLPATAQPSVVYEACAVIRDGVASATGTSFIDLLLSPAGQAALIRAGFGGVP